MRRDSLQLLLSLLASTANAYHAALPLKNIRPQPAASLRARAPRQSPRPSPPPAAGRLELPTTNKVSRVVTGVTFAFLAVFVVSAMYPLVLSAALIGFLFNRKQHRLNDYVVGLWAWLSMTLLGASVIVEGAENLPPPGEAIMYTPNHCSFLDIFVLSGYLPRRFKYISKIEILRIPLIGWAMGFAKHIAIRRTDRASQLKTLKDAIETLKDGNSLVT